MPCPASPLTSREGTRWFPQLCAHRWLFSEPIAHFGAMFNRTRTCFLLLSHLTPHSLASLMQFSLAGYKAIFKSNRKLLLGKLKSKHSAANNDPRDKDAT